MDSHLIPGICESLLSVSIIESLNFKIFSCFIDFILILTMFLCFCSVIAGCSLMEASNFYTIFE